ncbi:NAD(P)-binding protein [Periconia macrospinosa]|uniref:NAD(P)-binding protein n=1 Tax=Periconia macrospinosa TaxID=97972 RepID=A0A2V1D7Y0_9PLEO|nr:NAD(P)-binding protein [Periconia macrospinosa]
MPSYVVVGASRGIGLGYLKNLAANPANTVIGIARNPSAVESIPNATVFQGDLTDPASLQAAASKVAAITQDGAVDHLVVNGAYLSHATEFTPPSGFLGKEDLFLSELQNSMQTNVAGVLYSVNAFVPLLKKSAIKKVVAISTGVADTELYAPSNFTGAVPYTTSKAALNVLIAQYAVEYKEEGIKFLALSPGVVATSPDPSTWTPEIQAGVAKMLGGFTQVYPDWKGPLSVEESVEKQLQVIDGLTQEQSGAFLSHLGSKQWL